MKKTIETMLRRLLRLADHNEHRRTESPSFELMS